MPPPSKRAQKNAREHKENKSARAKEREAKRLEKWRELAANARAWVTHKKTQEKENIFHFHYIDVWERRYGKHIRGGFVNSVAPA